MISRRCLPFLFIPLPLILPACSTFSGKNSGQTELPRIIQGSVFDFASAELSGAFLATRDEYIQRLTPLDRALRLCGDPKGTEATLLTQLREQGREWAPAELEKFHEVLAEISNWARREGLSLKLPPSVPVYKSSNAVEFGMSFTRGNAIVLSEELAASTELYRRVLAHEVFHILSRSRGPEWQNRLYQLMGFKRISPQSLTLPPTLASRLVTNPDTFHAFVSLPVKRGTQEQEVIPLLLSKVEKNRLSRACDNFALIELRLLPIIRLASGEIRPLSNSVKLEDLLWQVKETNFNRLVFAQYGDHPEEIFADAFAHLAVGLPKKSLPKEILQRFTDFLRTNE